MRQFNFKIYAYELRFFGRPKPGPIEGTTAPQANNSVAVDDLQGLGGKEWDGKGWEGDCREEGKKKRRNGEVGRERK